MVVRVSICILCCVVGVFSGRGAGSLVHPKGTNLTSLVVIERSRLGGAAMETLMASLQGLVARVSAEQIYFDDCCGYDIWLTHLSDRYGVTRTDLTDPWAVLARFDHLVDGYVLYDRSNPDSVNAATSLCGSFKAIAVDVGLEAAVRAAGVTDRVADVRTRDEAWVWSNHLHRLNRRVVVEQAEGKYFHLRDYAVMSGAFVFSDGNTAFRTSVMAGMDPDATVLGWGTGGENGFVGDSSQRGVATVPSDWAMNLSTLSSVRDDSLYQRTYANPSTESGVHYVTFVVSDGDNVQWNLGGFPGYYNHPARGEFDMGWALSPSLADLAPAALDWYYASAHTGAVRDFFVAGPSGGGYLYPSLYPPGELDLHVDRLNSQLSHADLSLVQIIDFNSFERLDLWNRYTAQESIAALIYLEFAPYNGAGGAIRWSNGKPVIGAREMLWDGISGADEASVIAHLNSAPRDPYRAEGYSLVTVHVWSKNVGDIKEVVDGLAPDVRVVTPDVFVKLIQANIGNRYSYNFRDGLQGWSGGTTGKQYDAAEWTSGEGDGALLLDGSDLGNPDSSPNSWFSRPIVLPTNAVGLRFQTRALNDGLLRVRLERSGGGAVTLLDWEGLADGNWAMRNLDLSAYAGESVTIYFEQNDGGEGSGEHRFVDSILITTAGVPPQLLPSAPKLLDLTLEAGLRASLVWRDNGNNESGFKVERREGAAGEWVEVANLPRDATTHTDSGLKSGREYFYRVRAWNARGASAWSAERRVVTPAAPTLQIRPIGSYYRVEWPALAGFVPESAGDLAGPWQEVTETVIPFNNTNSIRVLPGMGARFFRLVQSVVLGAPN